MKGIAVCAVLGALMAWTALGQECKTRNIPIGSAFFDNVVKVLEEVVRSTPNGGYVKTQYGDSGSVAYGEGQCKQFGAPDECGSCLRGLAERLTKICTNFLSGSDARGVDCSMAFGRVV